MKKIVLCVSLLAAYAGQCLAVDPAKVDVYLGGELKQTISLAGYGSYATFSPVKGTVLVLRMVAPEPLIIDFQETVQDASPKEVVGRVKLLSPGSSQDLQELKDAKFRHPYVLVRGS